MTGGHTRRAYLRASLTVALQLDDAMELFTPEGERRWVPGWEPVYAEGRPADDTAPGTVFTTRSDEGPTTWIVLDRDAHGFRYARVSAGRTAGTVTVRGEPGPNATATTVTVIYDLSAVSATGAETLEKFRSSYEDYIREWQNAIAAAQRPTTTRKRRT